MALRNPAHNSNGNNGLAGKAYAIVRERIVRGELAMGEVISRRKLAAELGMSFLPVTEALIRLQHDGLLESRPRVGTRVRVPTWEDVDGHYTVREALEVQAAMLFAERATGDERTELLDLSRNVDAASKELEADRFVYSDLHEKLHRRIAECTACPSLSGAIERMSAIAATWLCATRASSRANPPHHHENLVTALLSGDPAIAAETMRKHLRMSRENALRRLEWYFRAQPGDPREYSRTPKKPVLTESAPPPVTAQTH